MFFIILRPRFASNTMGIIFIKHLYKELNLVYNLNTESLKMYRQKIISILQGIMMSTKFL